MQEEVYVTIDKDEESKYNKEKFKVESNYNYFNFLPSGKHYFYFIKQGKYYCLSERYKIGRFKNTNLFMNEVEVDERRWCITDIQVQRVDSTADEYRFDKARSVFRTFREETEELLRKMFEMDIGYSKIHRVIKNNEFQLQTVKAILWQNYARIKNIFLTCTTNSEYPVISWNDFTILCYKCKLVDKFCNLATIDRVYIATNVNLNSG